MLALKVGDLNTEQSKRVTIVTRTEKSEIGSLETVATVVYG